MLNAPAPVVAELETETETRSESNNQGIDSEWGSIDIDDYDYKFDAEKNQFVKVLRSELKVSDLKVNNENENLRDSDVVDKSIGDVRETYAD